MPSRTLLQKVRSIRSLHSAWRVVYGNGITSRSEDTRNAVREFEKDAVRHIERIYRQLQKNTFQFQPSEGVLQKKPGKSSKRPIVIAPIENRIVQRSILDVLQAHPSLQTYFNTVTSFGGIKDRGVADALKAVHDISRSGDGHFLRSDIESYFSKIPKKTVMSIISGTIDEDGFLELLQDAINTELSNLEQLGEDKHFFPIHEIGVAQGSCLSPLLGNILLHDFDRQLNSDGITCIRYIDDFIILAPSRKELKKAKDKALKLLKKQGLTAYDPVTTPDKAEAGQTSDMFSFLGCDIRPGMIQPNKKARKRILNSIDDLFEKSLSLMNNPLALVAKHRTVTETLSDASNILKGWGNQYAFCNNEDLMRQLDTEIDGKIGMYLNRYTKARDKQSKKGESKDQRRLLGVHLLVDSKKKPIIS